MKKKKMSFLGINETTIRQLFRYIIMGMTTMVVCWGSFFLLVKVVGLHYLLSVNLSTLVAWGYAFVVNKYVVFRDRGETVLLQGSQFFALQAILLGLSNLLMYIMVSLLGYKLFVALFSVTAILTICNFLGMKVVVFKGDKV